MESLTDAISEYCPDSPYREPWWRWGWAQYLLENRLPVRRKWRDAWFSRRRNLVYDGSPPRLKEEE